MRRNAWPTLALALELRQNVAAWAVMSWLAAQSDISFGPMPKP